MRLPFAPTTPVALVQGLEGAVFVALGGYVGFEVASGKSSSLSAAVALAMTAAVLGFGALLVCRGLYLRLRWARAPAMMSQIFALPVAGTLLRSGQASIGVPLALAAVVALLLLLYESATRTAVEERQGAPPQ